MLILDNHLYSYREKCNFTDVTFSSENCTEKNASLHFFCKATELFRFKKEYTIYSKLNKNVVVARVADT